MYKRNTKRQGITFLMGFVIAAMLFSASFETLIAQPEYPAVPRLSLTGADNMYNDLWYPDGKIRMPQNPSGEVREFLVPVFIDNKWAKNPNTGITVDLPLEPITSFSFKLLYDSNQVRPVGIETQHPKFSPPLVNFGDYDPLAKGFQIDWFDYRDDTYLRDLNALDPDENCPNCQSGRAVKIVASGSKPLPNTRLTSDEFKVLLYVRFRVILNEEDGNPGTELVGAMHIADDTITYNDWSITQEAPFSEYRQYDESGILGTEIFPNPQRNQFDANIAAQFTGLAGMDNHPTNPPNTRRVLPGTIWLEFYGVHPRFDFQVNRAIGIQPPLQLEQGTNDYYILQDPMTVDLNPNGNPAPFEDVARRQIEVLNSVPGTILEHIEVESDQPWLQFRTVPRLGGNNPMPTARREGYIRYIDNGLLGESEVDDLGGTPNDLGTISLEIICDPSEIEAGDDEVDNPEIEKTGIYRGHITFKSDFTDISPVKIQVTFIYFRPPLEGQSVNGSQLGGVVLKMTNALSDPDENILIFGTGDRATIGQDSLFGEFIYDQDLNTDRLDARFYPVNHKGEELDDFPFGLGDFAASDEQRKSNSRDIRSADDTLRSILYKVKFNPGPGNPDQAYPIVIEWNVNDFEPGAQAYLRDTQNGQLFDPVDMINEGTLISEGRRSFKIDDPRIREYLIEYTPPRIVEYVDSEGNPIINAGWNLLSMPVDPLDRTWNSFYKQAMNRPYYFFLSSYQEEEILRPGRGYFIKYTEGNIDTRFTGRTIFEVSASLNPVRLSPGDGDRGGWNTVGALSVPIPVDQIGFERYQTSNVPDVSYTMKHGVWGYETDRGLFETSELRPGLGYWLKVNSSGYYFIECSGDCLNAKKSSNGLETYYSKEMIRESSARIIVADNNQSKKALYVSDDSEVDASQFEMPPTPPAFDVRFDGNTELVNTDEAVIKLNEVDYPISISAANYDSEMIVSDAVTGEIFGTLIPELGNNVEIEATANNAIKIQRIGSAKTEVSEGLTFDAKVSPNPITSTSELNYTLTEDAYVTIDLYDQVGNKIATLVDEAQTLGENNVTIDAANLASGTYICKINAGTETKVVKVQIAK